MPLPATVTAVRELRGRGVAVELDGRPWRVVPLEVVARTGLLPGRTLDRPVARQLARELRRAAALRQAAGALRARDHSRSELEQRLERRGVAPEALADAVAALERGGLVDDGRFARNRAEALAARGYGNAAIRDDLERRGIGAEAAAAALGALEPERERAERLLRGDASPRAARRLAARGFGEDAIEAALGGVVAGDG